MHRLIIILTLIALLAAPVPGLAMRMLDESGQPVVDEQVQDSSDQSTVQSTEEQKAAAPATSKAASRAIIKVQPAPKSKPGAVQVIN